MTRLTLVLIAILALGQIEAEAQVVSEVVDVLELEEASDHLTSILQLIADSRGGAWALDTGTHGVIRFSETGEMLVFGREGEGPGEFERPWRMSLVRDTLWVVDTGLDRITGLDPISGEPLGTIGGGPLWRSLPEAGQRSLAPVGVTEVGVLVVIDDGGTGLDLVLLSRDEAGERLDLLNLERPDENLPVVVPGHANPIRISNPFSNSDLLALDHYGRYAGRVRQRPSFEVEVVSLGGAVGREVIPWPLERREVTDQERAVWLASQWYSSDFVEAGFFPTEEAARKAVESALRTDMKPVVRRLTRGVFDRTVFFDEDGYLWHQDWSVGEAPRRWYRLSAEGRSLEFTLEDGEILLDITGRFLWKQRYDSLDVPHLTRVELSGSGHLP